MKRLILLSYLFTVKFDLYSESVYAYDLKKDIIISALSIGVALDSFLVPGTTNGVPNELNRDDVNIFDRGLMFPDDRTLNNIRTVLRTGSAILPITIPLSLWALGGWRFEKKDFDTWLTYGIMYAQAAALTFGTVEIINKTVDRYRPRSYFNDSVGKQTPNECFPSDTAAFSFLISSLFSVTFSAEYPGSPWRIPVIAGYTYLSTSIGVISIMSGMHYLTDVLVGAAIGSFYGWLIPFLHRRHNADNRIYFYFTGNGGQISLKF